DRNGRAVVRVVDAPGRRPSLVATVEALDRAVADLSGEDGAPVAAPTNDDREPKLCPRPEKEAKTNNSANAIAYQYHVTGLPYPWAIKFGGVWFDGCDPRTGLLLDAKANMDFLFDLNDILNDWVKGDKNPANQMKRQSDVVTAAGRAVVWHAQTEKTYRGLKLIADRKKYPNLSVIYDPN
ncbi:MAG: Tox-REase-5 domain-containing protein, partial [Roseiarcus sp.]